MNSLRAVCVLSAALLSACAQDPPSRAVRTVVSFPPAPAGLDLRLSTYLEASRAHQHNAWRDVEPHNADGTTRITGWDDEAAALSFLERTADFFQGGRR